MKVLTCSHEPQGKDEERRRNDRVPWRGKRIVAKWLDHVMVNQ